MNTTPEDDDFLERLKRGDSQAYEKLYKDYHKMVASIVNRNSGGEEEDVEDLMQETMFAFIKMIRKPDFKLTAKLSTPFFSIARRIWLKKLRNNKGKETTEFDENRNDNSEDDDIKRKINHEKKYELLDKILKQLGEDCRKIIIEYYYKNRSLTEIAEEMEYDYPYARVKKNRCMNSYRKKMNEDEGFQNLKNEENE